MAPRIKMIVSLNLLWSEFAETNERGFDLLLQILITHRLIVCDLTQICRSRSKRRSSFQQTRYKVSLKLPLSLSYHILSSNTETQMSLAFGLICLLCGVVCSEFVFLSGFGHVRSTIMVCSYQVRSSICQYTLSTEITSTYT